MILTDPIADMLTRIRNAITAKHTEVVIPASNEKMSILNILLEEGYINEVKLQENGNIKNIVVSLKYDNNGESVIQGLRRISKPGLRVYAEKDKLPKVINGLGIALISTNKGILTDKKARSLGIGGEVLAFVW